MQYVGSEDTMKKSKNVLIIMLIVIEIVATYFMYKSSTNKEVVLDNVELKEIKKDGSFAIMVEKTEGSGEYQEYSSSTWPSKYNFNQSKSSCINEKGEIVSGVLTFNESENKAYVTKTVQTTYCYLYFDLPKTVTETKPSCTLTANAGGVTLNKSANTEEYGLAYGNAAPDYNSKESLGLSPGYWYGFVKNSAGTASCALHMKTSQVSNCTAFSSGGGSSSGGYTNCHVVAYRCNGKVDNPNMGSNCYSPGTLNDNCNGSTQYDSNIRTVCECDGGGSGGGSSSGGWVCGSTSFVYTSESDCNNSCPPRAGDCETGYTKIDSSSITFCWKQL